MPEKVLITGSNGFIGTALCRTLRAAGYQVRQAVRRAGQGDRKGEIVAVGDLGPDTCWAEALQGVDTVVHLAARVHVLQGSAGNPEEAFRRVNTAATVRLAGEAASAGTRRFVFLSTVKVHGERSQGKPLRETDKPAPQDPYARSKYAAEQALWALAEDSPLEVVILRPPLVYGPGVKGNFLQLMRWVDQGIPLPLGGLGNQRSFLYLGNLVDAILAAITHPQAPGNTFLLSDGQDLSTPDLIRRLAEALGRPVRLFPCPLPLLRCAGWSLGKSRQIERLTAALQVDSQRFRTVLHWTAPWSPAAGLAETARWYRYQEGFSGG